MLLVASPLAAQRVPLGDLGRGRYLGFQGGLYENGANTPPADHAEAGLRAAARIVPRDRSGAPSPGGKIVLLSIGMSNTTQEYCAASGSVCASWSFVGQALADPAVEKTRLVLANGAMGGQAADAWDSAAESNYTRIRDTVLPRHDVSEVDGQAWSFNGAKTGRRFTASVGNEFPLPEAVVFSALAFDRALCVHLIGLVEARKQRAERH